MKSRYLLPVVSIALLAACSCSRAPQLNSTNIDQVLKAMTLEEKATLVVGSYAESGADSTSGCIIVTNAIERLGIPKVTIATRDILSADDSVRFPSPLLMASSWDPVLIEKTARAIGHQQVDDGGDVLLAPSLNILRNPLAGHACENLSEDPLVGGLSAAAMVRGLGKSGIGSSLQYFAAANHCTYGDRYDACITPRTLREIYLKGFEIAIASSKPSVVTVSDNKINGRWNATNDELLTKLLRGEWKFDGTVIGSSNNGNLAPAKIAAGCDLLPPCDDAQRDSIIAFATDGRLSMSALDSSAKKVLKLIVSTPTFVNGSNREEDHEEPDLKAAAREAAANGIVLLENRYEALPIIDTLSEHVIVFEAADDSAWAIKPALEKELAAAGCDIGQESELADLAVVVITRRSDGGDRRTNDFMLSSDERSLIENTCHSFHAEDKYVVVLLTIDGVIETASWKDMPDAILLAFAPGSEGPGAFADVICGAVNPSARLTVTFPNQIAYYPSMLNFPQLADGKKAPKARRGKSVRSSLAMPPMMPPATGSVGMSYLKQDTTGHMRRMRSYFMLSSKDSAARAAMGVRNKDYFLYQEGLFVGYRFFTSFKQSVSYPFGYGLSYSRFDYSEADVIVRRHSMKVYVDVTNTGNRAGREVIQLYVVTPESSLDKPMLGLIGYQKTPVLEPGEKYTATFVVPFIDLASYNSASSAWSVDAGSYILKIGPSCMDIRSEAAAVLDNSFSVHTNDILQIKQRIGEMHLRRSIFRE